MRREYGSSLGDLARPPGEGSGPPNQPGERGSYRALELATRGTTPWTFTLRWRERGQVPDAAPHREKVIPYYHLGEIDQTGTANLSLITTYSLVHIEGENLSPIVAELTRRQVEAIQEWNPACWDAPPAGQPVIRRIWVEPVGKAG